MTGCATHAAVPTHMQIGGATLCRRNKGVGRLTAIGLLFHRAPRARSLTGLRAGTLEHPVYAERRSCRNIAMHSLPVATLRSARQI